MIHFLTRSVHVFYLFIKRKRLTFFRRSLVLVAPLVSALTVNPPTGVISGGTINFSWVTAAGDPYVNQILIPSFPLLTVFLAPKSSWSCSTQPSTIRSSLPTMLTYRLVILLGSARLFLLGMSYIVSVCALFLSRHPVTTMSSKLLTSLPLTRPKF